MAGKKGYSQKVWGIIGFFFGIIGLIVIAGLPSRKDIELISKKLDSEITEIKFIQSGGHFYVHDSPNIMVLFKKMNNKKFQGYYLAFTHDFLKNTKDRDNRLLIPSDLAEYPVSISFKDLVKQYKKNKNVIDFEYDMNFLTREIFVTKKYHKTDPIEYLEYYDVPFNVTKTYNYINNFINIIKNEGLRFYYQFLPQISYYALLKYKNVASLKVQTLKHEIKDYLINNEIEIPKRRLKFKEKLYRFLKNEVFLIFFGGSSNLYRTFMMIFLLYTVISTMLLFEEYYQEGFSEIKLNDFNYISASLSIGLIFFILYMIYKDKEKQITQK